jgi:sigma-B regulation protein RsbU (phosphoserine phosphatase)
MSKLQSSIRALVSEYPSISRMIEKINNIFYNDTPPNSFASLIYFELSAESEDINFVNAGHLPPVILKSNSLMELPKGSPALGLMKDLTYKKESIILRENDTLIAFSDGLTEAENSYGEFYGKEKALKLFSSLRGKSVPTIGESIIYEIDNFIGEAKTHDDISLIIIKKI